MTHKTKKGTLKPKNKTPKKHRTIQRANRIERPTGLTTIMRRYHTTENNEMKQKTLELAQQLILNRYVQEGLTLNGQSVSIDYLAIYLQCDKRTIITRMTEGAKMVLGLQGTEDAKEAYRALIGLISEQSLRDRGLVHRQVTSLLKAQGDKYVPFLTSAVNQSLDILLKTNKPLIDLLKVISQPGTNVQINNNNMEPTGVPGEKAIGPNEAVMIINQQRDGISLLENDRDRLELFQQYIQSTNLPEVIATKQIGGAGDVLQAEYKPTKLKRHSTRNPGVYPAE
jgi:hypothetical protein